MPDTSVKVYTSADAGASTLSGTAGSCISVLDACLVDGYGTVTLSSLVVSGNVATGTVSAGHGFSMLGSTGPVITIAGATPSALNGVWRVASVPSSTTFTFATSGISNQTATGTITAKRTPAGWVKQYSGTNKAAYKSGSQAATGKLIRFEHPTNTNIKVRGYESMTDVDTGTNPFPTIDQVAAADYRMDSGSPTIQWLIVADDRAVIFVTANYGGAQYGWLPYLFGDFVSYIPSDAHGFMVAFFRNPNSTYAPVTLTYSGNSDVWVARGWDDTLSTQLGRVGQFVSQIGYGSNQLTYPLPVIGGLAVGPITLIDNGLARGRFPGFYQPLHSLPGNDRDVVSVLLPEGTRDMLLVATHHYGAPPTYTGRSAIDITGPWR